jgi:hypothetical protein
MIRSALAMLAIAAVPATASFGAVIFYDNEGDFLAQMTNAGYAFEGTETFEENNLADNNVLGMPGPVCGGVPWVDGGGNGFPTGLDELNLCISATGTGDIALLTNGFFGAITDNLGANTFVDTTNMEFQNGVTAGVGFIVTDLLNLGGSNITVYDTSNNVIGTTTSAAGRAYVGVYSDVAIGYINVAALNDGGEMLDDISMYNIPGPASLGLLALAGLARRRRR